MEYIKKIHFEVCKGQNIKPLGDFRDKGVGIMGTNWRPKLPSECDYESELKELLSIPVEKIGDYLTKLIHYYETNDMNNLKKWIYDNCIDGI